MDKFKEALEKSDKVKVVLTGVGETDFSTEEIHGYIKKYETLADIGRALIVAFEYGATLIVSINAGEPIKSVDNVNDLLDWCRKGVE